MYVPGDIVIDRTLGTNIGDMTAGGGLAAAFDGEISESNSTAAARASATNAYVGKTLAELSVITRAVVYGSNNQGYVASANPTVTLDLYGKTGVAPANSTDGTLLGTLSFTDTANESATPRNVPASVSGTWAHVWIRASQGGAAATMYVAEVSFYEDWDPEEDENTENNPLLGYHNLVDIDNIAASSEDADFPATNLANVSTALKWVASSAIAQTLTVTVSDTVDYVGLAAHNFGTAGITVSLEGRSGTDPFITLVSSFTPTDDAPIILRFPSQSLTDVRVSLGAGSVAAEAAILYAGELIVMQQGIQAEHVPLPRAYSQDVVNGRSESGNFLGRIITGARFASTASFANIEVDWYLDNLHTIALEGYQEPFFWVWRPEDRPEDTSFAWMVNDPQPSEDVEHTVAFDFDMVGIA